ncbi:MAG: diadenylate cyclase CdaA [Eubacterium sp.]|nr:diadenylate cyclase CdaA [Eubacterium sp.]
MPFEIIDLALKFRYIRNLGNSISDFFSQVKGLLGTFGFIDVIDILFVAVIIYMVIRIIRDTRAMQLIKGLLFLLLLYLVVNFLGMDASSYIMKGIFSNILIIVVILFGPEIRNILEAMGKGAARSNLIAILDSGVAVELNEMKKTIDAVCKACTDMSDSKTGALIVFEKETMLGDIIASGTIIQATATKELIENIFFPKSPLHDGAMIIRSGKVYAAGCILPLTSNNNISSSLGTRHRAAIGVSQQSDAIVVVVSEETGNISVAIGGNLKTGLSTGDLRDILANDFLIDPSMANESAIKKFVRRMKR